MKNLELVLVIIGFILVSSQTNCPVYEEKQLEYGQCVELVNLGGQQLVYTAECLPGQTCEWDGISSIGNCVDALKYPGEICSSHDYCLSKLCENNACKGKQQNQQCSSNQDCDLGLYCSQDVEGKTCQLQRQQGESCINAFDCGNDLVCNGKICVDYFSGDIGDICIIYSPSSKNLKYPDGFSWVCNSLFCDVKSNTCSEAPRLKFPGSICTTSDDCVTIDQLGAYLGTAECGCPINNVGQFSYCGVQSGDEKSIKLRNNFLKYVYPYIPNIVGKCNTDARFRFECWSTYQNTEEAIKSFAGSQTYDLLEMINYGFNAENNDNSVLQIVDTQFDIYASYQLMVQNQKCFQYQCVDVLPNNKCINIKEGTNQIEILNKCPINGQVCPPIIMGDMQETVCSDVPSEVNYQFPGMFCRQNKNCVTGICGED